jgi:hypothetical protein
MFEAQPGLEPKSAKVRLHAGTLNFEALAVMQGLFYFKLPML